ncbi:MAG: hypothetical protein ACXW5U_14660 [Thermoanaerobaculia bacterium]
MPSLLSAVVALLLLAPVTLAAGRDLAPRPFGPSAYSPQAPLVASAGGKYLTVWLESLDRAGWRYLGAFSDSAGKRLSPTAFVVIPYGIAGPGQLIGTGDSFALFFSHEDGLQMIDIDLEGRMTGTRIVATRGDRSNPSVAWNGTHFAALERTADQTRVVFFDRGGTIIRSVALPCHSSRHSLIAVRTDVIVPGVCDGAGLRADWIARHETVSTTILDPSFAGSEAGVIGAAAPGNGTLLAWGSPELDQSVKTTIVSASGTASPPRTVAQDGFGQAIVPLLLMKTSTGFLLPYTVHGNLRVAKLDDEGVLIETNEGPQHSGGASQDADSDTAGILVADVYYGAPGSRPFVRTRLVSADAQVSGPELVSIVAARQLAPVLAAGSGTLVAAWTEMQGSTSTVKAARIAIDGTPLGNAVVAVNASLATDDLAWSGAEYLTVIASGGKLRAQRITAFGEPVAEPAILGNLPIGIQPRVAAVWAGDHWVVVWTDTQRAFHAEVASNGTVSRVKELSLEGTLPDESTTRTGLREVALAFDGSRAIVAWIEGQVMPCRVTCLEARVVFVSTIEPDGTIAMTPPLAIDDRWSVVDALSLATNGRVLVVVAGHTDSWPSLAASIDTTGTTLTTTALRSFDGVGDVAWDGSAFVLALRERDLLTVRRLDANLRDTAPARIANIARADSDDSAPSIAVAISGNAILGLQECNSDGGRAVVYAEQELAEPRRRRTVRR